MRPHLYVALTILILASGAGAVHFSWPSGPEIHTSLGLVSVVLALAMGLGAIIRFCAKRNVKFLFIGSGFLGTATLDALHTVIGTGRLQPLVPVPAQELLPLSWNTSQIFLGAMLLMGSRVGQRRSGVMHPGRIDLHLGLAAFVVVFCFVFALAPLDPNLSGILAAGPALGAWAGIALLAALWTLVRMGDWRNDPFEHWLVAAVILACGSQFVFPASLEPVYGPTQDTAHMLKIGAYALALTGVLHNGYRLFVQTDQQVESLAQLKEKFRQETAQREAAEAALRTGEERFSLAVEGSNEGFWDWPDISHPAQWWSPRFYTLLGYQPGEIESSQATFLRHLLDPEDHERNQAAMAAHLERSEPFDIEFRLRTKQGSVRWFRSHAKAFRPQGAAPIRMAGAVIDVHSRKLAETKIREQADELKLANEELEQFAYAASHDLQEPLRNLIVYCEMLRADLGPHLSDEAATDLHYIEDAAKRMRSLVEALLALSRAGRAALAKAPVDIEECVRHSLANLRQQVLESHAQVRWDGLPKVQGDPTMLTQLYQNLISNALKFRGEVPPYVALTAEPSDGYWILGVRDNGIGIESRHAERIFSPFQRLHGVAEYEGSGIGLAICRKTVERHGGKIWVESEPGRGAHFKFTLPDEERQEATPV